MLACWILSVLISLNACYGLYVSLWVVAINLTKFCWQIFVTPKFLFSENCTRTWISSGSLALRRTPRVLLGSLLTMISTLGGWRKYSHANGCTPHSYKRLEFLSSCNLFLMPASPTSSQMSVTSTRSSQTSLFRNLLSCLEIIPLKWALIYMLKTIRYHLPNFVTYAWSLLMGA